MTKRRRLLAICAVAFYLLLLTHESQRPRLFSRYSTVYGAFLLAAGAALLSAFLLPRTRWWRSFAGGLPAIDGPAVARFVGTRLGVLIAVVFVLHGVLVLLFLPPHVVFSDTPILHMDYAHHFHQVAGTVDALSTAGRHWSWDPSFCAGYPAGTLFDVDMKLFEGIACVAVRFGAPVALMFNCMVLLSFLLPPLLLLLACRNFGISRSATFFVVAVGSLLWHADGLMLLFNESGMCSFVLATYWSLWIASLFYRLLERPTLPVVVGLTVAASVGWMLHILMPVIVAAPLATLYAVRFRTLSLGRHGLVLLVLLLSVAANWWWIGTVLEFMNYRVATAFFGAEGAGSLFRRTLGGAVDLPIALLGAWGFWILLRTSRALGWMGIASVACYFFLAYLSGPVPILNTLEPYRFQIPLYLFSAVGLVVGVAGCDLKGRLGDFSLRTALPIVLVLFFFGMRVVVPASPFRSFRSEGRVLAPLAEWIETNTSKAGRIAFLDASPGLASGARMRFLVDREYIGGPFSQMNLSHSYASFTGKRFFDRRLSDLTQADVERYARLYNIKWVVTSSDAASAAFASFATAARTVGKLRLESADSKRDDPSGSPFTRYAGKTGELDICIFELAAEPSYFLRGTGRAAAERNRIEVTGASPDGIVLKYHWLDTWAVDPPMPIRKYAVAGSPIGFIEIANGATRDFTIYNAYDDG